MRRVKVAICTIVVCGLLAIGVALRPTTGVVEARVSLSYQTPVPPRDFALITPITDAEREASQLQTLSDDTSEPDTTAQFDVPSMESSEDRLALDQFISTFTEAGLGATESSGYSFDVTDADAQAWATLTTACYMVDGGKANPTTSAMKRQTNYEVYGDSYVDASVLDQVAKALCGVTCKDWSELETEKKPFRYANGAVYMPQGYTFVLYGPAVVSSATAQEDGTLRVLFSAYFYPDSQTHFLMFDTSDETLYKTCILNRMLHVDGPNASGEATLACERTDEGWDLKLQSLSIRRS